METATGDAESRPSNRLSDAKLCLAVDSINLCGAGESLGSPRVGHLNL